MPFRGTPSVALVRAGARVNFPHYTTAKIQISVEYLVFGLRKEYRLAGRRKWPCSASAREACFRGSRSPTGRTFAAR